MVISGSDMTANHQEVFLLQVLKPAAEAISQLLGIPLRAEAGDGAGACSAPDRAEDILTSLMVSGDFSGELVMRLSSHTGLHLAARLLGSAQNLPLNQRASSALLELGNILASVFVTELENQFALSSRLHPPRLITDLPQGGSPPLHCQLRGADGDADIRVEICLIANDLKVSDLNS